ncbi:MAG TPA: hypothetical protein VNX21_02260, partial [Candidatus Thermoplasmatota archaeon]|nr:hypothetical protein [Candidatus Thermoplasmatota archaeon]
LAAPPRLVAGEWWRLRFDSPIAEGGPVEVVRVVAEVHPDGYVFGMPHEGWYKEVISYHAPPLGDVGLDLSYATHNEVFQPVKFPLEEGLTWRTAFAAFPFDAVVESVDGPRATVKLTPAGEPSPLDPVFAAFGFAAVPMTLVYDATVHEVVRFDNGYGAYEVVAHGYGFEGWVTIPRGEHTAIDFGTLGPASPDHPAPTRTVEVAGGFNRLTMMEGVFPFGPGAYRVRTVAPDGTAYVTESTGKPVLRFYEVADPDGTWTVEDLVVGPGAVYHMGIAYHQYDIRLPDGAKRSDHSHEVIR